MNTIKQKSQKTIINSILDSSIFRILISVYAVIPLGTIFLILGSGLEMIPNGVKFETLCTMGLILCSFILIISIVCYHFYAYLFERSYESKYRQYAYNRNPLEEKRDAVRIYGRARLFFLVFLILSFICIPLYKEIATSAFILYCMYAMPVYFFMSLLLSEKHYAKAKSLKKRDAFIDETWNMAVERTSNLAYDMTYGQKYDCFKVENSKKETLESLAEKVRYEFAGIEELEYFSLQEKNELFQILLRKVLTFQVGVVADQTDC